MVTRERNPDRNDGARLLREHGLSATPQRLAIYEAVAASREHPSPEDVLAVVRRTLPTVSLGTVYRTLERFAEIGLARRVTPLADRLRYDANLEPHHHLVCTECRSVSDITDPALDAAIGPAQKHARRLGFTVEGHVVEVWGRCESCRTAD